jgi:hypothetical protein
MNVALLAAANVTAFFVLPNYLKLFICKKTNNSGNTLRINPEILVLMLNVMHAIIN